MNFKITLSKSAEKAVAKGKIPRAKLDGLLERFIQKMDGKDVRIDFKELKGVWRGYYRIRSRDWRIILKPDFLNKAIFIKRIGTRGDVYK